MKRLPRILLNAATLLSLVLLAATCTAWVRSYSLSDRLTWKFQSGLYAAQSARGQLITTIFLAGQSVRPSADTGLSYLRDLPMTPFNYLLLLNSNPNDIDTSWERGGFAWYQKRNARLLEAMIVAPFWSIALAAALLPLTWVALRRRRARQTDPSRCPTCGYDLRATPDRCPECGTKATLTKP